MYHIVSHRPQKIMHTYTVYHITKIARAAKNDLVKYIHENYFLHKKSCTQTYINTGQCPWDQKMVNWFIYFITSLKRPRLQFTHRISRLKQEKWQTRSLIGKILGHFEGIRFCKLVFESFHWWSKSKRIDRLDHRLDKSPNYRWFFKVFGFAIWIWRWKLEKWQTRPV